MSKIKTERFMILALLMALATTFVYSLRPSNSCIDCGCNSDLSFWYESIINDDFHRVWDFYFSESKDRIVYTTAVRGSEDAISNAQLLLGPDADLALRRNNANFSFTQSINLENSYYEENIVQIYIELLFEDSDEFLRVYDMINGDEDVVLLRIKHNIGNFNNIESVFFHNI